MTKQMSLPDQTETLQSTDSTIVTGRASPESQEQSIAEADYWASRRRIEPLNDLLRPTVRWMLRLPPDVRPFHLCHRYARIGNQLAASWTEPDATYAYLFDLLHDRRGGRRGFPADVKSELIALYVYFVQLDAASTSDAGMSAEQAASSDDDQRRAEAELQASVAAAVTRQGSQLAPWAAGRAATPPARKVSNG